MTSFTSYRTRLLSEKRALAFAAALKANPRFAFVAVERSARAKGPNCFLVRFEPSSVARRTALLDQAQDARIVRAATQGFTFAADPDAPFCHCLSHSSGEVYETTLNSCSCPDEEMRCSKIGLACKHRIALALAIRDGEVTEFTPPVRRAFDAARFNEIFA